MSKITLEYDPGRRLIVLKKPEKKEFYSLQDLMLALDDIFKLNEFSNRFIQAARDGNLSEIKRLHKTGVDINKKGDKGYTALMVASFYSHFDVVKYLVENGADINASTDKNHVYGGMSVIIFAARGGNKDLISYLIDKGANINKVDKYYKNSFMWAAAEGNLEIVKYFIEIGADPNAQTSDSGFTTLMWAAEKGKLEIVKILVKEGANINAVTSDTKYSVLMFASKEGHFEVVKYLIENGADINYKTYSKRFETDINSLTLAAKRVFHPIRDKWDVTQYLLENGGEVDPVTPIGRSILIDAAEKGKMEIVKMLMNKGGNPNTTKKSLGITLLMFCAKTGTPDIVEKLIKNGANINSQDDYYKQTPLMYAVFNDKYSLEMVKILVENGAKLTSKDRYGNSPFMWSVIYGKIDVVQYFLTKKIELNQPFKGDRTLLEIAIDVAREYMYPNILDLLKTYQEKEKN